MKIDDSFGHVNPILTDYKTAGMFDPTVSHVSSYRAGAGPQNNEPQFGQFSRIICYLHQQGIQGFGN